MAVDPKYEGGSDISAGYHYGEKEGENRLSSKDFIHKSENGDGIMVLRKTIITPEAVNEYIGDAIINHVMRTAFQERGTYDFLLFTGATGTEPMPDNAVHPVETTYGPSQADYFRPFVDGVPFSGWEEKDAKYTEENVRQLAAMVFVDIIIGNWDRTKTLKTSAGNLGNIVVKDPEGTPTLVPIDNQWGQFYRTFGPERTAVRETYKTEVVGYFINHPKDYFTKTWFKRNGAMWLPPTLPGLSAAKTTKKAKTIMVKFWKEYRYSACEQIREMMEKSASKMREQFAEDTILTESIDDIFGQVRANVDLCTHKGKMARLAGLGESVAGTIKALSSSADPRKSGDKPAAYAMDGAVLYDYDWQAIGNGYEPYKQGRVYGDYNEAPTGLVFGLLICVLCVMMTCCLVIVVYICGVFTPFVFKTISKETRTKNDYDHIVDGVAANDEDDNSYAV